MPPNTPWRMREKTKVSQKFQKLSFFKMLAPEGMLPAERLVKFQKVPFFKNSGPRRAHCPQKG